MISPARAIVITQSGTLSCEYVTVLGSNSFFFLGFCNMLIYLFVTGWKMLGRGCERMCLSGISHGSNAQMNDKP